eukprot:7067154-Lingulodinium_polyedra.AAC.1
MAEGSGRRGSGAAGKGRKGTSPECRWLGRARGKPRTPAAPVHAARQLAKRLEGWAPWVLLRAPSVFEAAPPRSCVSGPAPPDTPRPHSTEC